jgi:hypothetical protein
MSVNSIQLKFDLLLPIFFSIDCKCIVYISSSQAHVLFMLVIFILDVQAVSYLISFSLSCYLSNTFSMYFIPFLVAFLIY